MVNIKTLFFCIVKLCYKLRYRKLRIEKGDSRIYPGTSIAFHYCNKNCYIKIGKDVKLGCFNHVYRIGWYYPCRISVMGPDASIEIDEGSLINGVNIYARKSVKIGKFCHIASGTQIIDSNGHLIYKFNRYEGDNPTPVIIGDNVWIGLNSIILKGSEIGENSVIASGSVVKGKFPPYSLIAGNPAKLIKILDKSKFA